VRCYSNPFDDGMVDPHRENLMIVHQCFCQGSWCVSVYISRCDGSASLELKQRRLEFKRIKHREFSDRSHVGLVLRVVQNAQTFPKIL